MIQGIGFLHCLARSFAFKGRHQKRKTIVTTRKTFKPFRTLDVFLGKTNKLRTLRRFQPLCLQRKFSNSKPARMAWSNLSWRKLKIVLSLDHCSSCANTPVRKLGANNLLGNQRLHTVAITFPSMNTTESTGDVKNSEHGQDLEHWLHEIRVYGILQSLYSIHTIPSPNWLNVSCLWTPFSSRPIWSCCLGQKETKFGCFWCSKGPGFSSWSWLVENLDTSNRRHLFATLLIERIRTPQFRLKKTTWFMCLHCVCVCIVSTYYAHLCTYIYIYIHGLHICLFNTTNTLNYITLHCIASQSMNIWFITLQ